MKQAPVRPYADRQQRPSGALRKRVDKSHLPHHAGASSVSLTPTFFTKVRAPHAAAPSFPQTVSLGSAARLGAPSQRLAAAANRLRHRAFGAGLMPLVGAMRPAQFGVSKASPQFWQNPLGSSLFLHSVEKEAALPLLPFLAKGPARLVCSFANAHTMFCRRCRPFSMDEELGLLL